MTDKQQPKPGDLEVTLEHNPRMAKPWRVRVYIYDRQRGWTIPMGVPELTGEPDHCTEFRKMHKAIEHRHSILADEECRRVQKAEFTDHWERVL